MREYFTTNEVADLFKVSVDTIRAWRTKKYAKSSKQLIGESLDHSAYVYHISTLTEWLKRNPKFIPRTVNWNPASALPKSIQTKAENLLKPTGTIGPGLLAAQT